MKRIWGAINKFFNKATEDSLAAYAAQTTFFVLLSFFPFMMLLIMIASKLSIEKTNIVSYILSVVPEQLKSYIIYIVDDIMYSNNYSFTIITVLVSLWSAGKGIQALTYGLDKIYCVDNKKNYFLIRLLSAIYTLVFIIMCMAIMVIYIFGTELARHVIDNYPKLANATIFILSIKGAFMLIVIFTFLVGIYYQLPGRKGHVKYELLGAGLSSLGWMALTKLFSVYIRVIAKDSYMYGSLTSIILVIVWLYFGMQVILYGAEINYFFAECIENRKKKKAENS